MDMTWYVLTVTPQCERAVGNRVKRLMNGVQDAAGDWSSDDVATFVPILRWKARHVGRWRVVERLLFPRYLFVGFAVEPPWLFIRDLLGVTGVLALDGAPYAIDAGIVGTIMMRLETGFYDMPKPAKIQRGMTVVATSGPFRGCEGRVAMVDKGKETAHVLFDLFDRAIVPTPVHIDRLAAARLDERVHDAYSSRRMNG